MKKIDKDYILQRVGKSLDIQFELYSWDKMLEDTFLSNEKKELKYAKEHISYRAYIVD